MRRSLSTLTSALSKNRRIYHRGLSLINHRLLPVTTHRHLVPAFTTRVFTQSTEPIEPILGHCPGCGASFQKEDANKPGFLVERKHVGPKRKQQQKTMSGDDYQSKLTELDPETLALLGETDTPKKIHAPVIEERVVCQRCYSLQHHNVPTTPTTPQFLRASQQYASIEFLKTKQSPLIVAVFDITDMPGSLGQLPSLLSANPTSRIMFVANKLDILPGSTHRHGQRMRDWIIQYMKSLGVPSQQVVSVTLISAKKGWGVSGLMKKIEEERRPTDDVYLVGCTNVGKSALVNQFMSQVRGSLDREARFQKIELKAKYRITSSPAPGTTIGAIKIPLHILGMSSGESVHNKVTRDRYLVDTPGIVNDQQLIHGLSYDDQKKMVNQREMHPITFRLEPGKSLLLKPLIRIDLLESSAPVLMTLFTPLVPHLTRTSKLDTSNDRAIKDESIVKMNSLKPIEDTIRVTGYHSSQSSVDFSFAGIGWVALAGEFENARFKVWLPDQVNANEALSIREPPFLPFEYKGSIRKFFGTGERTRK
ncbi:hypothetical protein BDB01DRAFT_850037 [Pilobolus umbonatus]|nr:hypothetical protein BDB01DRAFT_850037 [Pilobolus umbonatus]